MEEFEEIQNLICMKQVLCIFLLYYIVFLKNIIKQKSEMKILVTGGCGFVGANICINLKKIS